MIDPTIISNFDLDDDQLEEVLLFWIAVAGKNAKSTSKALDKFLDLARARTRLWRASPFRVIRKLDDEALMECLVESHIGNYKARKTSFRQISEAGLNLKTCSKQDLMKIYGIKHKTASAFLVHSRKDTELGVIDTHILKFLRHMGIQDVPNKPPSSAKQYKRLQDEFLQICENWDVNPAELDLAAWNHYRVKPNVAFHYNDFVRGKEKVVA